MDSAEIVQLRRQLESARSIPEKALAVLIDAVERIVSHLESERESRVEMKSVLAKFDKQLYGWHDESGRRHPGFVDGVAEMKESSDKAREQSRRNGSLIKKLLITVVGAILVQLIIYVTGRMHFGQ